MKLKVLVDNNTFIDQYYIGEPAVSFYIEDENTTFLFDTGYSDAFIKNAHAMNIDLKTLDGIIISHGHDDHTRGLKYYFHFYPHNKINLLSHPLAFKEKKFEDLKICSPILDYDLKNMCNLTLSKSPIKISSNITFLGEIPKLNDFEPRKVIGQTFIENKWTDDYVKDDTALVYQNSNGLFIITGCSHSGICNIIEYAKKICNDNRILGVIGGFHLFHVDSQLHNTINYFKDNNITNLYPCHCTSFAVKAEIHSHIPIHEVGVGLKIEL